MKHALIIAAMLLMASFQLKAQADKVVGIWLTEKKNSQVEIYKTPQGTYEGKLVWLKEPLEDDGTPKKDKENPEPALRSKPLKGLIMLEGFTYDRDSKEWTDGTIYDPESGSTYTAYMWFDDNNTLKIKGYVMGMRFLGRSTTWTRERQLRQ
ncbi:MAG: DUF2147 domain-containing protein [Bacteroidota bacterium]